LQQVLKDQIKALIGKPRPKILFALAHAGFFRNFDRAIYAMVRGGAHVEIIVCKQHKSISMEDYEIPRDVRSRLKVVQLEQSLLQDVGTAVRECRAWRDMLHYQRLDFAAAGHLRARITEFVGPDVPKQQIEDFFADPSALTDEAREQFDHYLAKRDYSYPESEIVVELLEKASPDLVIATPVVGFGSREVEFFKAAKRRGIRTMLAVASWDNLTNKGVLKYQPDTVAVWNADMADEATRLHGVDKKAITTVGATVFDWLFDASPSMEREDFFAQFGFDPAQPLLLYLCSSHSIAGRSEQTIFKRWLAAVRKNKKLQNAGVLVRPHPMALETWEEIDEQSQRDLNYRVWPERPRHPTADETRATFYDSMYYASAVVGLNTSTMIEAAILRRPVLSFTDHDAAGSQTENLHFKYLENSGFLSVGKTMGEHIKQIIAALDDSENIAVACDAFIDRFVRPVGRNKEPSLRLAKTALKEAKRVQASNKSMVKKRNSSKQGVKPPSVVKDANNQVYFEFVKATKGIRTLTLEQVFPGISSVPVELGAIDTDTAHLNKVDMIYVVAIARHIKAKKIFEFGTYLGRTTAHLAMSPYAEKVYSLDISPDADFEAMKLGPAITNVIASGLQGHFYKNSPAKDRVTQLHGDTRTFDYGPYEKSMDFIFVDAGHTYDLVKNDTEKAMKLVGPKGVVVWHDFAAKAPGLVKFFQEFSREVPLFHIRDTSLLVWINGVDPRTYEAEVPPYAREVLKPPRVPSST
jgi:predicted O-methyltransferase YrrM